MCMCALESEREEKDKNEDWKKEEYAMTGQGKAPIAFEKEERGRERG